MNSMSAHLSPEAVAQPLSHTSPFLSLGFPPNSNYCTVWCPQTGDPLCERFSEDIGLRMTACAPPDVEEYSLPSKVTLSLIFPWLSIVMKCQGFTTILTLFCNVPEGTQPLLKHWFGPAGPTDLHHLSF